MSKKKNRRKSKNIGIDFEKHFIPIGYICSILNIEDDDKIYNAIFLKYKKNIDYTFSNERLKMNALLTLNILRGWLEEKEIIEKLEEYNKLSPFLKMSKNSFFKLPVLEMTDDKRAELLKVAMKYNMAILLNKKTAIDIILTYRRKEKNEKIKKYDEETINLMGEILKL